MLGPSRRLRLLAVAAALSVAAGAPAGAATGLTNVTVMVGGYEAFGALTGPVEAGSTIWASLDSPDGHRRADAADAATADGGFELVFSSAGLAPRHPVTVSPGDRLAIGSGQATLARLQVPGFSALADAAADTVSGLAPADGALLVTAHTAAGGFASRQVRPGPDGRWSATFGPGLDLGPGAYGAALFTDQAGITWQVDWSLLDLAARYGSSSLTVRGSPGPWVSAEAEGEGGPASAAAPAWERDTELGLRGATGALAPLGPGRLRLALDGAAAGVREVPPLSVAVDPATGTVSGHTLPGLELELTLPAGRRRLTADAAGAWSLALPASWLDGDTPVTVTFPSIPWISATALEPRVRDLDPLAAIVEGQGSAGLGVSLRVHRGGTELGRASGHVGPDGRFRLAALGADGRVLPRVAGDTWHLGYDGGRIALPITPLSARADGGAGEVWGEAGAEQAIRVRAGGAEASTRAGADGGWRVQLGGDVSLAPGSEVEVLAGEADGPITRLVFPTFRATVEVAPKAVFGGTFVTVEGHAGLAATASLERGRELLGSGHCAVTLPPRCQLTLRDAEGRPLQPQPGDTVTVSPELGATALVDVLPLSAHIDAGGRDVVGQAPPGESVRIAFSRGGVAGEAPLDTTAPVDNTGVYDYELSASEWPLLTPGLLAEVTLTTPTGHRLLARAALEALWLSPGHPNPSVIAEPGALVRLALERGGRQLGGGEAVAMAGAWTGVWLVDDAGRSLPLAVGDRLRFDFGRGQRHLTVPPLAAWRGAGPAAGVMGITAPGLPVRAEYCAGGCAAAGLAGPVTVEGPSDAAGTFVLPAPTLEPPELARPWVWVTLPNGDAALLLELAPAPGRLTLPWLGQAAGPAATPGAR